MNIAERVRHTASPARLVVRCLGRFRIESARGDQLQVRTRKARALLAALALSSRPMSREKLADMLWSDRGPAQAKSSLRQAIFEIQHLECGGVPVLVVARDDVAVHRQHLVTDVDLIGAVAADGDWARLLALLEDSESGLLTDLDGLDPEYDDWLRQQRSQEPERTLAATVGAAERCKSEAGPRSALDLVSEILRLDPVNEEATRLALKIDHELGDSRALHHHFSNLAERLRMDFDTEPSEETSALFHRLANGSVKQGATSAPTAELAERKSRPRAPRAAALVPAILLAVAVALLIVLALRNQSPPAAAHPTVVAVLPFEEQPENSSFIAEGLREQTRAALTRNTAVRLLGRTTTEVLAQRKLAPDQYLKRLGVTHLLEGHVRRSGDDIAVSVSLTRTSDGITVWHDMFRGRMDAPFALQDAIANGIEGKLRARLAPDGGRRAEQIATTPEVYSLYSEARHLISTRERTNFRRAEALLRRAVKADPNYAPAWSLLGAAIFFNGRIAIVDANARAEGMAAVRRALAMAPNFAPAHATMALLLGDASPEAEPQLRQAVALDPSYSEAWNWLGNSLIAQGRSREAIAAYRRALEIDPLLQPAVLNLASLAGDVQDERIQDWLMRRIVDAGASDQMIANVRAERALSIGDYSTALQLLSKHGTDGRGRMNGLLWVTWFETLTGSGHYDVLHSITGCPDWYAPMVLGQALPPKVFEGKPVVPEEFWTSYFFSTPATRAMIKRGHFSEIAKLYRAGFESPDDFITQTERRDMLPELAANVALAVRAEGKADEADYLLSTASARLESRLNGPSAKSAMGRLALVRAVQGKKGQAAALLQAAVARGWLPDGRTISLDLAGEPAFAALKGDSGFEAARKRILDHIARERAELGPLKV
jgi:DNA-binding SARP family transcriptional activator/TolB-like protein/Tfp pilus assembly protein PilF